ncbi:hypothetical protein Rsub_01774 [Raphidocelis subcapitata]|uniref:Uncharacterized protein n=1 Tax=Raphidocelis subcapitata TaxID=307507 RepID=A0A2V0NVU0_9CHLO|nr:hypothetical protein Rsub_01774 [Raphidocelis subcapitata]|eukprot:GBF89057.1 hypothetical protein Rsub_01774 [Raphidocelis subcapitata]
MYARSSLSRGSGSPLSVADSPGRRPDGALCAAPACVLDLYEAAWYGTPGGHAAAGAAASSAAAARARPWYANPATGSTPSLYQDDVMDGLLPEALPPADGAPGFLHQHEQQEQARANGYGSPSRAAARRPLAAHHWQQQQQAVQVPHPSLPLSKQQQQQREWQEQQQQQQQQQQQEWQEQQRYEQEYRRVAPVPIGNGDTSANGASSGQGSAADAPVLGTWAQRRTYLLAKRNSFRLAPTREGHEGPAAEAAASAQPIPGAPQSAADKASGGAAPANAASAAGAAAAAAAAAAAGAAADQAAPAPAPDPDEEGEEGEEDDEEVIARAAWRWRFAKRWQAEQVRQLDPSASAGEGDGMEEALEYLAACGQQWDLSRTMSDGMGSGSVPRMLGTMDSGSGLLASELLVGGDASRHASFSHSPLAAAAGGRRNATPARPSMLGAAAGAGAAANGAAAATTSAAGGARRGAAGAAAGGGRHGAATRELTAVTRRATALLQTVTDLDRAAEERWREAQAPPGGELWVGALLETVEIDDWGKFKFVLVRLRDHAGRQKLVVRGANYSSEGKLLEGLHRQVVAAAAAHEVPTEPLETVGGGVMEWRRDRDRHLHLHSPFVAPTSGMAASEVLSLTAVLSKQSLPIHYRVTAQGGKAL